MNVIWKYDVPVLDEFAISLPKEAEIVHVGSIGDKPYMWVIHDPINDYEQRTFYVRGTGHNIKDDLIYIGTFIILSGEFVGHLFEEE
jgi:hypothetical protein